MTEKVPHTVDIESYQACQGWLLPVEAHKLQELAEDKNVLEIGVWKGRSAVAMAAVAEHVTACDYFRGDGFTGQACTLKDCWQNLWRLELTPDWVTVILGTMYQVVPRLDLAQFDFAFYDANHTYEHTRDALQMLDGVPVIAVHDYKPNERQYGGVIQAVGEFLKASDYEEESETAGSIKVLRRRGS